MLQLLANVFDYTTLVNCSIILLAKMWRSRLVIEVMLWWLEIIVLILVNRQYHLTSSPKPFKLWLELNLFNNSIPWSTSKQLLTVPSIRRCNHHLSLGRPLSLPLDDNVITRLLLHYVSVGLLELLHLLLLLHLLVLKLLLKLLPLSLHSLLLSRLFFSLLTHLFFLASLLLLHLLLQNVLELLLLVLLSLLLVLIECTETLVE